MYTLDTPAQPVTEQVMRKADIEDMGVKIGGLNVTDLRYADDTK